MTNPNSKAMKQSLITLFQSQRVGLVPLQVVAFSTVHAAFIDLGLEAPFQVIVRACAWNARS